MTELSRLADIPGAPLVIGGLSAAEIDAQDTSEVSPYQTYKPWKPSDLPGEI
ncbi:MAG: hypothetical protein OEN22_10915 [Gammaproteobacteria bacterium]|nr:hypothetical protein [Gammaproteobacteria bacterium]